MAVTDAKVKAWGNSMGIIIPRWIIDEELIEVGDDVVIEVHKKKKLKDLFGTLRDWKIDSQKMKDELRKGWE
ncbi:hypothetical protein HYS47_01575 [Candidatus Woesearchaeota archaeon]|nr:hypothetical protein [Candidatus Woesearchaeota archaeon]